MSLLYRMGTGNGSGGDLKPYIVQFTCDSGYIGQTLTMTSKGTPHAGETVDNVSGIVASDGTLTLYPMHSGNWECSCYSSVTGTTMKKTIELSYWGTTNVSFKDSPNGATVTPTDDVQTWLHCANVWDKTDLTTIDDVIAETTTLNTLIANENANDYLVRSTTWASDICNNESAMTYIGLNDYCANKLLADSTWLTAICNSAYFKKVLNIKVPNLISNTGDDGGIASASSQWNDTSMPYLSFNGDTSKMEGWSANTDNAGEWLNYEFPTAIKPYMFDYKSGNYIYNFTNNKALKAFKIQGSNDGTDYTDLTDEIECPDINLHSQVLLTKNLNVSYKHIRLYITQKTGTYAFNGVAVLQFYGREEA